jgi:4-hydroxy-2-oxoheptanedioate aldolase
MNLPKNRFKAKLHDGTQQIGLWCTLASAYSTELVAGSGFDWLLLDTEHTPAGVEEVMAQLQAISAYDVAPIVRPASNDAVLIKRYLDIGVQTLLIPYVQSAEEARAAVSSIRYPPAGIRGVSAITRATRFGRVPDYALHAESELCLLVQIETQQSLDAIEDIASVDGVDGLFIGPGDLAASLGHVGQPGHAAVKAAVEGAIRRIVACGKPAGILTGDIAYARQAMAWGTIFTAVGVDAAVLARGTETLLREFKVK